MSEKPLPHHIVATPNGVEIRYLVTAEQAAEHFDVHLADATKTPAPVEFWHGRPKPTIELDPILNAERN